MSKIDENWIYEKHDIIADYDDKVCRKYGIESAIDILGYELEVNPEGDGKSVDLRAKHEHNIGVEVERGHWIENFWEDDYYSTLSNLGFQTVNMPKRKGRYYQPSYYVGRGSNRKLIDNSEKMDKVIFERWNWDGSQVIIVHASVVHDSEKLKLSEFIPNNNVEKKVEKWLSFKRGDVITMNKQVSGNFISDTEIGGEYVPLTPEERKKQLLDVAEDKARVKAERAEKRLKRAVEVYQNSKKRT